MKIMIWEEALTPHYREDHTSFETKIK
jgi:hypothetical protein